MTELLEFFSYSEQQPLLFSTKAFVVFFSVLLTFYALVIQKPKARTIYLLVASLFFYYKTSGVYWILLLASILVNFALGLQIERAKNQKTALGLLWISVLFNLGLLGFFKYTNFFVQNINWLNYWFSATKNPFDFWVVEHGMVQFNLFLPVGISFFTFQVLSYTIDVYRKKISATHSLFDFGFFVSFFPQLVAGPIVRAADFIPQISKKYSLNKYEFSAALLLILSGLVKKVVISDYLSVNFVDRVFATPLLYSQLEVWLAYYAYAVQIFCDFSGYSDMAIGIAKLLGFDLPLNFNKPYQSASITEFWRRWHISLSSWLKDYLYISLGGNKKGSKRTYVNLFLTMLIGGFWHGANWQFIIWGALHGIFLLVERFVKNTFTSFKIPRIIGVLITFHLVAFCWILFRSVTIENAFNFIQGMFIPTPQYSFLQVISNYSVVVVLLFFGFLFHFIPKKVDQLFYYYFYRLPIAVQSILAAIVLYFVGQVAVSQVVPFIYFQF